MLKKIIATVVMCVLSMVIILSTRQYKREELVGQQQQSESEDEQEEVKSFDIWLNSSKSERPRAFIISSFVSLFAPFAAKASAILTDMGENI